jgi:hypothetical protein
VNAGKLLKSLPKVGLWVSVAIGSLIVLSLGTALCVFTSFLPYGQRHMLTITNQTDRYLIVTAYRPVGEIAPGLELRSWYAHSIEPPTRYDIEAKDESGVIVYQRSFSAEQLDEIHGQVIIASPSGTMSAPGESHGSNDSRVVLTNRTDQYLFIDDSGHGIGAIAPDIGIAYTYPSVTTALLIQARNERKGIVYSRQFAGWELKGRTLDITVMIPSVTNALGATEVSDGSATLNGNLIHDGGIDAAVHIYWGATPGGKEGASWEHDENLGMQRAGPFSKRITGLTAGKLYYYICYASNSLSSTWAAGATSFVAR